MIMQSQLRWCGHVHRMPDSRIPKQLLYGQLADSARSHGGQRKRYKDHLRLTLKFCDIYNSSWESIASDRLQWRHISAIAHWHNSKISVSPAWMIVVHAGRTKQGCKGVKSDCEHFQLHDLWSHLYVADRHVRPSKAVQLYYFRHGSSIACHRQCQLYFHVFIYTSIYLQYLWTYMYIPYWNVCSSASEIRRKRRLSPCVNCVCWYKVHGAGAVVQLGERQSALVPR